MLPEPMPPSGTPPHGPSSINGGGSVTRGSTRPSYPTPSGRFQATSGGSGKVDVSGPLDVTPSTTEGARGEPADDVALEEQVQHDHRRREHQHGRGQQRPVVAVDPREDDEPTGDR